MLTVTAPATDKTLLTLAELRQAVGVTDTTQDATLNILGPRVAAVIARACRIATDGINEPSLKLETLEQLERPDRRLHYIILDRRMVKTVTSVMEDGTALDSTDYEVDRATGFLYRLEDDKRTCWDAEKIVITYQAGLETIPADLKFAAAKLVSSYFNEGTRDPNLKREKVEGVSELEYWVGSKDDPALPNDVMEILRPYADRINL